VYNLCIAMSAIMIVVASDAIRRMQLLGA
jgi:hypothetical protein